MKSKKKQRILALILSMVLMLSASISALAEGDVQTEASGTETTENQAAVQSLEQETVPETEVTTEEGGIDTQSAETSTEPVQENTEQEVTETPAEPEQGVTEETAETTDTTQSQAQSTEVQEESDAAEEIPVEEQPGETTEETVTEETVVSEAAELKQEFTDENGNVTQTVTAYVPEGAFQATADQISMEVSLLNTDDTNYIKGMMEELLSDNHYLDGYVLYQIDFKVNGEIAQPAKAITITMIGNELEVEDSEKAHVFYYVPEDPEIEGDEDQLAEVIQKDQLLQSLEKAGENTGNIEDYDYSEIVVQGGKAETIAVKGWESTIYGCYVEKEAEPVTLEGSAEGYHVALTGPASSFPEDGALTLSVKEVSQKTDKIAEEAVEEEAEKEDLQVVNYTALDITILKDGKEIQPLGPVNVTFTKEEKEEKESSADTKPDQIKVFHVDEETGKAQDMEATEADEGQVAIETDHFSVYVVVDLDKLGGEIELTVQHWATVEQLVKGEVNGTGTTGLVINGNTATLKSENVFTRIYTDDTITLYNLTSHKVDDLSKVLLADANVTNPDEKRYILSEIWVLKDGRNRESTSRDDWETYSPTEEKSLKLSKDAVIRMVYTPVSENSAFQKNVRFYDYNVMGGTAVTIEENQWGTEYHTVRSDLGINDHTGNLMVGQGYFGFPYSQKDAKFNGKFLNRGNGTPATAVTGMVKSQLDSNGDLQFSNGIRANHLFDNTPVAGYGKKILDGYQLSFDRTGDVYTLSSVSNTNTNQTVLSGLDTIRNIGGAWSNNFWPLDGISYTGKDVEFGGHTNTTGGFWRGKDRAGNISTIAQSDDKAYHNWFFGMRYEFEFTIGDYEGPLNFYFRGDDDFWLYVDGELKVDLGGIHSAIGSYLDLSYLRDDPDERNKTHTISIFYAERGAFGSCCYMQFTLPNVKSVDFGTEPEYTSVTVNKVWQDHNNPNRPASIQVELYYRVEGSNEEWTKYDTKTLSTANNWTYTWTNMPKDGYEYRVHEVGEENGKFGKYRTEYSGPDGKLAQNEDGTFSGTITNSASPSTFITVTKVWNDGEIANNSRPDSVDFYLYYRNQDNTEWIQYPNGKLTLTAAGGWTGKYENLPVYWGDTKHKMIYTVMEINGNDPLSNGEKLPGKTSGFEYTVSYPKDYIGDDNFGKGYVAITDDTETPKETLNLTVTNSLGVSIKVNKEWKGRAPENDTVIYAGLYQAGNPVADKWVELKADNNWTATFQYLSPADYSVKELRKAESGDTPEFEIIDVISGVEVGYVGVNSGSEASVGTGDTAIKYVVSYSQLTQDTTDPSLSTVTITNQAQWQLIKYSSSKPDKTHTLKDAVFDLEHDDGTTYKGVSGADGIVKWTKDNVGFTGVFPDGYYTLTETAAPIGYALGDPVTFEMKDGVPVKMNDENAVIKDGILTFYYANDTFYAIPSSGGSGIYKYLFGGVLLMMAASLIVYKNKRREVLEGK
ncbi:MAG TPA: Cna B-type domain-containing protein [Candidatus Blautia merdigallinarum]|uniref:Cna B-type domain-containing protein n=1 Tax=Candidatus Blautia merdigallinarum TaxID=2838495 RepID=A0A9D2SIR9_9FIRM|nr:Cna B-type domain-containing protein [Candidatus Blautia merdigallinarum]